MNRAVGTPALPDGQKSPLALIAAGGTGGHLFPAQALGEVLRVRGWRLALATDERVDALSVDFPGEAIITLPAATIRRGRPLSAIAASLTISRGLLKGRAAVRELQPAIVVGFGGYPSVPGLLAAISCGAPTLIHEQNAVFGRANRFLAPWVSQVATGFDSLDKASERVLARRVVVGNPVRPAILALYGQGYTPPGREIHVLVTGGSQGARLLSEGVPRALAALPEALRARLKVEQQTRPESLEQAAQIYAEAGITAELAPFFRDIAARLARAHLVFGRAGASTVTELTVAGRPSILTPLGIALDNDQGRNAGVLVEAGAALVVAEGELTGASFAADLERLLGDSGRLASLAAAAASLARPDAAERLADLVERTVGPPTTAR